MKISPNRMTVVLTCFLVAMLCSFVSAETAEEAKPVKLKVPFVAEVTGTDVQVRSGPGLNYYRCGKLSAPARVIVVGEKYGWIEIVPPKGSFSWISKAYVEIDPGNPQIGIVTGDSVRVYAGADHLTPRDSHSLQTRMDEGEHVRLTGKELEDYYQILPPTGAHLYVSNKYLKYVGPLHKEEPAPAPPAAAPAPAEQQPDQPAKAPAEVMEAPVTPPPPAPVPAEVVEEALEPETPEPAQQPTNAEKDVQECLDLENQVRDELQKPLTEQNYAEMKDKLNTLLESDSEKARQYAQYLLDQIGRFELAIRSAEQVRMQDDELQRAREKIRDEKQEQLKSLPNEGKYAATGLLKLSSIYTEETGQKRYIVVDKAGKITAYAVAAGAAATSEAQDSLNSQVGLIGEITPDDKSPISLVRFTDVIPLD